ncbi:MFS transporter [Dyadobacter bucti]|uniref:MFS transporter n=1 Tax=Dyadobacter bucti TaxID=2572203 RepID=UPI001109D4B7|nr:MFS transporter [Dyadobacter bucti]
MINTAARPTKIRYTILAAVFVNVVINYMDRSNISVAGSMISKELDLDSVKMGYVFSAFGWTYASLQIPSSVLIDRYGVRVLYALSLVLWSAATVTIGIAEGFVALIALRLLIGMAEAPAYPMNNSIVTSWFPDQEKASAIATYTSGQYLGLAFLTPLLTLIQSYAGWRGLFYITGTIGVLWGIFWYFFYRNPSEHAKVNQAELTYIREGGGGIEVRPDNKMPFAWKNFGFILSKRKLWGIYLGQFCVASTSVFFITWFPQYLINFRKMDFIKSGIYASFPFICAFLGVLLSGFLSDYLVKKNISPSVARKTPVIFGMLLGVSILFANYVTSPFWVIFFMSVAFFGNGLASITWVFVSLLAPKNLIGLTGGTFNFMGGLASIIVPIVIGYLVRDGDFSPALVFVGFLAVTGGLSYIFLVGKVERVLMDGVE